MEHRITGGVESFRCNIADELVDLGWVNLAHCPQPDNYNYWVYFPSHLPVPEGAIHVRTADGKYDPREEDEPEVESDPDDPDGGSGALSEPESPVRG